MNFTSSPWPFTLRFRWPRMSLLRESAPHCMTTTSGLQLSIAQFITFLKIQKQLSSSIPGLRGTLIEQPQPIPYPVSLQLPVPGKKSLPYQWKETVMTLFVLQKAYSTPSPWWTSMSRQSTLGQNLSNQRMQMTISFTQQNPDIFPLRAWWQPPAQLMAISSQPVMMMLAQSKLAPTESWQKLQRPSQMGQSISSEEGLEVGFLRSSLLRSSGKVLTISVELGLTQFQRYFTYSQL